MCYSITMKQWRLVGCIALAAVFSITATICLAQEPPECLPCHGIKGFSVQASDQRVIDLYINPNRYHASRHGNLYCYQCHANMATQPHAISPVSTPSDVLPYVRGFSPALRPAAASCVTCHPEEFQAYEQSIHAKALREGKLEAPFCINCHGSHYILGTDDLESAINPQNVPATCASCHAVDIIMSKLNISTHTYQTFRQSVHGRKLALGEKDVAVCTSCHGVHDIKSPSNPASALSPTHITATCRKCHKGASRAFATSFRHSTPSPSYEPIIYYVQSAYTWLIRVIIGVMVLYVLLDIFRRIVEWSRRRKEMCS